MEGRIDSRGFWERGREVGFHGACLDAAKISREIGVANFLDWKEGGIVDFILLGIFETILC